MSAAGRGAIRAANDNYQTPEYLIIQLFVMIDWLRVESFCEPCRGESRIYDRVPAGLGIEKHWYEIAPRKAYKNAPRDYLDPYNSDSLPSVSLIVTNPPFSRAQEFLDTSLTHAQSVFYLVRLNFWGSEKRREWWGQITEPTHQFVIAPRPSFTDDGQTDACEYCWLVWDYGKVLKDDHSKRRFQVI